MNTKKRTQEEAKEKILIYQTFPRWFDNSAENPQANGTAADNGVGKFAGYTQGALREIADMGISHVWYTGVIAHATMTDYSAHGLPADHPKIVKGRAGSAYAIRDYYDVDPDLALSVPDRMQEFEALVERTHAAGMRVVVDFVPNHVARSYRSTAAPEGVVSLGAEDDTTLDFSTQNNFYYINGTSLQLPLGNTDDATGAIYAESPARVTGNDCFSASPSINDWFETIKLNYGIDYQADGAERFDPVPDTWHKMRDILRFWAAKGVDGFRCDMAEMVPVAFWQWVIPQVKAERDVIFIAEVYTPARYRAYLFDGCFDYLYDKVGLYDTLCDVLRGHRSACAISQAWQAVEDIQPRMLNFMENHDEVRLASDFLVGSGARAVPAVAVSLLMNTNPFMLYAAQELGERGMDAEGYSGCDGRTTIFDYWSVPTQRRWVNEHRFDGGGLTDQERALRARYVQLMALARRENVFANGSSYDLGYANETNPHFDRTHLYAFLRKWEEDEVWLVVVNFNTAKSSPRIILPQEVFDSLRVPNNGVMWVRNMLSDADKQFVSTLTDAIPYALEIGGNDVVILKFCWKP